MWPRNVPLSVIVASVWDACKGPIAAALLAMLVMGWLAWSMRPTPEQDAAQVRAVVGR